MAERRWTSTLRLGTDEAKYVDSLAAEADLSVNKVIEALIAHCRDECGVVRIRARWTVETDVRPAP